MGCFHAAEDTTAIHRRRRQAGLAEGVGFEPTVGCPTLDFESSALNRTQPPFHFCKIDIHLIDPEKERVYYEATPSLCKSLGSSDSSSLAFSTRRS